jgi:hypothetical protein
MESSTTGISAYKMHRMARQATVYVAYLCMHFLCPLSIPKMVLIQSMNVSFFAISSLYNPLHGNFSVELAPYIKEIKRAYISLILDMMLVTINQQCLFHNSTRFPSHIKLHQRPHLSPPCLPSMSSWQHYKQLVRIHVLYLHLTRFQ